MTNANFYYGRNKSVVFKIAEIHKYFMWILNRRKFKTIIYRTDYDLIHLNSMILSPIVSEKCKLILHVGEVFESMGGLVYEGMYSGCRFYKQKIMIGSGGLNGGRKKFGVSQ